MNKAQTQIKTLLGENFSTVQTLSTIRINYRSINNYIDDKYFYAILATQMKISIEDVKLLYKSVDLYEKHFVNQEVAA
tara:strand:+ start:1644 stop:1877 length:234 start_codon:yes stop_codon:yes gene_type:complete